MLFLTERESIRMLFVYQANFHDTESALLSHEMREKVSVFLFLILEKPFSIMENGVAL